MLILKDLKIGDKLKTNLEKIETEYTGDWGVLTYQGIKSENRGTGYFMNEKGIILTLCPWKHGLELIN